MTPRRAIVGICAAVAVSGCTAQVSGNTRQTPGTAPTSTTITGPRNVCAAVGSADMHRIFGAGLHTEFQPATHSCLLSRTRSGRWTAFVDSTRSPVQAHGPTTGDPVTRTTIAGHPALLSAGRLDVSSAQDIAAPGDIGVSWVGHDPGDEQIAAAYASKLTAALTRGATGRPADRNMCAVLSTAQLRALFGEPMTTSGGTATHCTYRNRAQNRLSVNIWKALPLYANVDVARRRFSYRGHPAQLGNNEFGIALGKTGKSGGILEALGLQGGGSYPKGAQRLLEQLIPYYAE
jgi:hypothetical protein